MSDQFNVGHVAQLNEIQNASNRQGRGGIGREVEALIRRLNDHGVVTIDGNLKAARQAQAKRYWDLGFGRALGHKDLKSYLESVPDAPRIGLGNVALLHPWLLLIEPRVPFQALLEAAKVTHCHGWITERNGDAPEGDRPFWVAFDEGRRHRGLTIRRKIEVGGNFNDHGFTAFIGLSAALQKRDIVGEGVGDIHDPYYLYLYGSRHDSEEGVDYANLQTTSNGDLQLRSSPPDQACAAYGCPSYVRY